MEPQTIRMMAFQIASQLPPDLKDAHAVLALAGELIRHVAALDGKAAEVVPLRTVD
jgi:hypothetical protein